ncbi:MAG: hypothetical protein IT564_00810 [Rhodospirillales bacterium]|nr:hypothetical protein [Rhodospirillales bacterium]
MADSKSTTSENAATNKPARPVFGELEAQGFFRQIQEIEESLKGIAEQLANFARSATERAQETESFAAHILALQAIAAVLARHANVAPESVAAEVREEIKSRTAKLSGNADGSPEVLAVAATLLGEKR